MKRDTYTLVFKSKIFDIGSCNKHKQKPEWNELDMYMSRHQMNTNTGATQTKKPNNQKPTNQPTQVRNYIHIYMYKHEYIYIYIYISIYIYIYIEKRAMGRMEH